RFLRSHGIDIDVRTFLTETMGMPTSDVLNYYFRREVTLEEAKRLSVEKESVYRELYLPKRRAAKGLRRFLRSAKAAGFRLGLGTGSRGENVGFILDGLRLRSCFDAVVDADDIKKGKPDPETFLALAARLKVRARNCVVFEDSLLGEEAARRAGMTIVAVTTSHKQDEFRHAKLAVRDFLALTPSRAAALLR